MNHFRFLLAALMGGGIGVLMPADAASPASVVADDKIILLSPFEVNTGHDAGYQAFNSLAGGRIDTPLDRTAAALSILTREFLDDIAAGSALETALWSPNSFTVPASPEVNEFRADFRSSNTGSNPLVNYFNFAFPMDTFSTERIEFVRGPNSILFGQGNLSGIMTVNLKQPRFRDFGQVQLRVDDFESRRVVFDLNRQFLDGKAALRFAALRQDGQGWRKPNRNDREGYFLAGAVKLGASAAVRFEAEYGTQERTWAEGIFLDNASAWTGAGYAGTGTTPVPNNQGMIAIPTNADYLVFDPARPERGVLNYRGFARTNGNAANLALIPGGRPYVPNFPVLPKYGYDLQPPNNLLNTEYYFTTLYIEKRFGAALFVQLALNQRQSDRRREGTNWSNALRRDPNLLLPNGASNPDFGAYYVDGEPTSQRQTETLRDYRLLASYRFESRGMQHRLNGYLSQQRGRMRSRNERFVRTDNPAVPLPTSGSNFIQQRYYLNRGAALPYAFDPAAFGSMAVRRYRNSQGETGNDGYTLQVAAVSDYFGGRLNTVVGYRRDDTDRFAISSAAVAGTGALALTRRDFGEAIGTTTAGAVWYPAPWFGPFFNYSESFSGVAPGDLLLNSKQSPETPRGRTREFGFFFKLAGDRVQGSLRYYDAVQHGRLVNAPGVANINTIWQALGQTTNVETGAPRDTQSLASTGFEFEATAQLARSWRTMLNFALPRSTQSDSFPETIAYRERYRSQWQAAATNPMVATGLQALDAAILSGADGRAQNTRLDYRANIYSSFDFRTGTLRGFGLGAGANFFGRQIAGNVQNQPFNYIYGPGYTTVTAHVAWTATWRNVRCKIQGNVSNVFDRRALLYTSVAHYTAVSGSGGVTGDYLANFRYVDPRKLTLTTTFDF